MGFPREQSLFLLFVEADDVVDELHPVDLLIPSLIVKDHPRHSFEVDGLLVDVGKYLIDVKLAYIVSGNKGPYFPSYLRDV